MEGTERVMGLSEGHIVVLIGGGPFSAGTEDLGAVHAVAKASGSCSGLMEQVQQVALWGVCNAPVQPTWFHSTLMHKDGRQH